MRNTTETLVRLYIAIFCHIGHKQFWKEHTFWSDGYFVCSIGEANPNTLRTKVKAIHPTH